MSIARATEVKALSPTSFDEAIKTGVARAHKTLKNVKSAWVEDQEVLVYDDGKVTEYRIHMKVTLVLED